MRRFLTLFFAICILFFQCQKQSGNGNDPNGKTETSVPVEFAIVEPGDISAVFSGTATLETEMETEVVAKISGVVEQLFVEEADAVKQGQILAKLDEEKLRVQANQALANLNKLENEYNRNQQLYEKSLVSTEEFQRTQYEYEAQKASVDLVKLDLAYTSIRAPIDGVIAERTIKVGNMVLINQGTFRITGLDPLRASVYVPEQHMVKLEVGQQARLAIDALGGQVFPGKIQRISPVVDPATGTVKVTVEVQNPDVVLKPGMFARIDIVYDTHMRTLLVPKDAVITEDDESSVFIVQDSLAFRHPVETGYVNADQIEILSGVTLNDTIVTTGKGALRDSARVELVQNGG